MINRQKFIKQTAASVAGLALSHHALSGIFMLAKKEKLGVALMGLGYYSTDLLAPALLLTEKCYLAGIITGTPSKAEKWKAHYSQSHDLNMNKF